MASSEDGDTIAEIGIRGCADVRPVATEAVFLPAAPGSLLRSKKQRLATTERGRALAAIRD
jgi:hypothetical protein